MDHTERLAAIEDIKALKARYFRCMDTKDWHGFAEQFAPDAVMDVSEDMGGDLDAGIIRGNHEISDFVRSAVGDVVTVHHGHMPEIDGDHLDDCDRDLGHGGHAALARRRSDARAARVWALPRVVRATRRPVAHHPNEAHSTAARHHDGLTPGLLALSPCASN